MQTGSSYLDLWLDGSENQLLIQPKFGGSLTLRTSNLPVNTTSLYSTGVSPTSISPAIAFFQPASATQASVSPLYQVYAFNFAPVFVSFTESASQLDSEPFVVETTSQYIRHSLCYGQQCVSSHEKNLNVCRTVINIL